MRLGTPRSEQGQMVVAEYGWCERYYYRRTTDLSDRSVQWHIADAESAAALAESSYEAGGSDDPPAVRTWTPCAEPTEDG